MTEVFITKAYLRSHPDEIFVFGDNCKRRGNGGAAKLRNEPNTYGFITKKKPTHSDGDYYKPGEYKLKYVVEMAKLIRQIMDNPNKTYLISKLGAGLANRYNIFQDVIEPDIKKSLASFKNVRFLW